ncbi:MAG TPA: hypothetical protein VF941_10675, partial [Clostridia bacterium]
AIKNKAYNKSEYESGLLLLAKGYFKFGALEHSKELLLNVLELNPRNNEAKTLLAQIYAQLRSRLLSDIEKDPNNEDLKHKLSLLKSEIYKKNKKYDDKATSRIYRRIFLIGAACIIVLFFLNNIFSNKKITPTPPVSPAKNDIVLLLNEADLDKLPSTPQKVHVKFSNIKVLRTEIIESEDKSGNKKTAILRLNGPHHELGELLHDEFVCIGTVNNKEIIFVARLTQLNNISHFNPAYFLATDFSIANLGSSSFDGIIQDIPSPDMISAISSELELSGQNGIINNLNKQKYIVIDEDHDPRNPNNYNSSDSFSPFLFVGLVSLAGLIISGILRRTTKS